MTLRRSIVIESECIVTNLDFPLHLDHAWLFIASGIHLRLYRQNSKDEYVPDVIQEVKRVALRKYHLIVRDSYFWSDNDPIVVEEVANALARGQRAGIFRSVRIVSPQKIEITVRHRVELVEELLASPLFTITPSCRNLKRRVATCGPYVLIYASEDRRIMTFKIRKEFDISFQGPMEVTIVVTENREQGIRLLNSRNDTLSCPLGANPLVFSSLKTSNKFANRLTNLGLILRPYPACSLTENRVALAQISAAIRREDLADVTSNTFIPLLSFSGLFNSSKNINSICPPEYRGDHAVTYCGPKSMELRYVDFEPNSQVANEIKNQLHRTIGIHCTLVATTYSDYVASRYPQKTGISLEIIQPFLPERICRMKWDFLDADKNDQELSLDRTMAIPLLQGETTLISFDSCYKGTQLLTKEALLDWREL